MQCTRQTSHTVGGGQHRLWISATPKDQQMCCHSIKEIPQERPHCTSCKFEGGTNVMPVRYARH